MGWVLSKSVHMRFTAFTFNRAYLFYSFDSPQNAQMNNFVINVVKGTAPDADPEHVDSEYLCQQI